MVMTKAELISSLQNEVRILLHLATKIDRSQLDYRPTPKQRSTLELIRYLSIMGPELVKVTRSGNFDPATWSAAEAAATARDFDQTLATIEGHSAQYESLLNEFSDADLRAEIAPFGYPTSKGKFLVDLVLCGCAAYRTQLFNYLKACGREELNTYNLWAGVDPPAKAEA